MKNKLLLTLILLVGVLVKGFSQAPPAPDATTDQYFCSQNAWALIGEDQDYLSDLQIFPDTVGWSINWYTDAALTNPVANPSTETLVDGTTYYVTQTDDLGNESPAQEITVVENDCACIKDPTFEDQNGNPSARGYEFVQFIGISEHRTCGQLMNGANAFTMGAVDAPMNSSSYANLVTPGQVPDFINSGGASLAAQYQVNLPRTNPSNPSSSHAMVLNKGAEYGGPNAQTNISAMQKQFIAGEIFAFSFDLFIQNPGHLPETQPFVQVRLYDLNGDVVRERCLVSDPEDCLFNQAGTGSNQVLYPGWTCLKFNTSDFQGEPLMLEIVTAFCTPSQHFSTIYIDDIYVGEDRPDVCGDSAFGYASVEQVSGGVNSCYISEEDVVQNSCTPTGQTQIPGFPLEICGFYDLPISTGNPAAIGDIALNIIQNNTVVGTVTNYTQGSTTNEFCFTINASDINVIPYGDFTFDLDVDFDLDCGTPYDFAISDDTTYDLCPTTGCPEALETCDSSGNGTGNFDLTDAIPDIRGNWTANDLDITFYDNQIDALDGTTAGISDPTNYINTTPNNQIVYARIDWNPNGATSSDCYYLVEVELIVSVSPDVSLPTEVVLCEGDTVANIIATPSNIQDLQDVSYQWFRNGVQLPHTGSYYGATQAGIYEVIVSEYDCETSMTVEVIDVDFDIDLGDVNPLEVCGEDGSVVLSAEIDDNSTPAINEADLTYLWSTGETTKDITVTTAGNYSVEVSYLTCSETADIDVSVATLPNTVEIQDITKCRGEEVDVTLEVTNISAPDLEYIWYLDGGVIAGATSSTIMVEDEGTYTVEVNEIGSDFCFASEEFNVSYYANADCVITQGISPDTTPGENDCLDLEFLADRAGIENIKLYSRYGRLVFEEDDYVNTFCGQNMDGDELPTGTYYYVLVLESEDEIFDQVVKGWIYINREAN